MSKHLAGALLASVCMVSTAQAATSVDNFMGTILANPADAAQINARCDRLINEITRLQAELEAEKGAATLNRTLQRYDDLVNMLGYGSGEFTLYRETGADQARRDAGGACEVRIAGAQSKLSLSRPIYDRLKKLDVSKADAPTKLYVSRTLAEFERAGVALPTAERAKVQALQEEIAAVGTKFDANIAAGRKTVTADPAELAGLPADYIAAHKPGPDGKITISTDYPDYQPVMVYSQSEPLRQRLALAYATRAYPDNDPELTKLFNLRHQLATMLGRPNYATLVLENKMLDTPAKVQSLIDEMAAAARPAGQRDYAKKLAMWQKERPGATAIDSWNNGYLSNKVQKAEYAYDRQEARKYFAYNNVRDGILKLTEDLFNVDIRPWQTTVWDPAVEAYEMYDKGKLIGQFYFDSHPRPGKYSHANMVPVRAGLGSGSVPVAALVMNFPAGDHSTGLMEHSDVVTFLHEFGHMIHGMFSGGQRWAGVAGISTEWDFVEAPSQMLENWVYDYDTLKNFAVDAQGNTIPRELVEKMNKARYFDMGMGDMRQLGLSNASLQFHMGPAPADIGAAYRAYDNKYGLIKIPDNFQTHAAFGHLNGYSAIYYTYRWSKVIADDLFTQFKANGMRDQATADRYRRLVLEPGGSKPAAELVQSFLGRPVSLDAYRAEIAKVQ